MKYLLDNEGYYLAIVDSPTEGIEINTSLPDCTDTQKRKWNGANWIVEDSQELIDRKTAWDAQEYARNRQADYPNLAEQFDLLWHAIDADTLDKTSDFYTTLKAVKDAHPKG
jgi:hypothetical protein